MVSIPSSSNVSSWDEPIPGRAPRGKEGRKNFVDYVGEFLNEMRATDKNKRDWKTIAERFDT